MIWRLFRTCVVSSRCPLCGAGALFETFFRMRSACSVCGLDYDQWVGEWITPTYLASTAGTCVAIALAAGMLLTGIGLEGPLPPELSISVVAGAVALLLLRPSKALWLAFLFGIGGIEVSAQTRARLRWFELEGKTDRRHQEARPRPAKNAVWNSGSSGEVGQGVPAQLLLSVPPHRG